MKEEIMKEQKKEPSEETKGVPEYSRRSILLGSAVLLAGGIAGRISNVAAAPEPKFAPAPPLPWEWTKLDPLEAGRRAYRSYLEKKG
jgi:hypothetical protein